jgi:hypothetical protein
MVFAGVIGLTLTSSAWASRAVTNDEQVKLTAALTAQGCSGGKMRFDDGKYEVDEAVCSDGKRYDVDFDGSFKLLKKKLEK